jgi:hypothetical protein
MSDIPTTMGAHGVLRFLIVAVLAFPAAGAAADLPQATCEEIRTKIGELPPADPELLRALAARRECGFTAAQVYRAAYGDKPMPMEKPGRRHRHEHEDHDD